MHRDVKINEQNLADLPENGVILDVNTIECTKEESKKLDACIDIGTGPVDYDENEVYNTESEIHSFISKHKHQKRKTN